MGKDLPAIHGADHLPGGPDPIWEQVSSLVQIKHGTYTGENVDISPGSANGAYLKWGHADGDDLLDITGDLTQPTVKLDGLWRVTAPIGVFGGGMSEGDCFTGNLSLFGVYGNGLADPGVMSPGTYTHDYLGGLAEEEQALTVVAETIMRAGSVINLFVFHENQASLDQTFRLGLAGNSGDVGAGPCATVTWQAMDMTGVPS